MMKLNWKFFALAFTVSFVLSAPANADQRTVDKLDSALAICDHALNIARNYPEWNSGMTWDDGYIDASYKFIAMFEIQAKSTANQESTRKIIDRDLQNMNDDAIYHVDKPNRNIKALVKFFEQIKSDLQSAKVAEQPSLPSGPAVDSDHHISLKLGSPVDSDQQEGLSAQGEAAI